MERINQFSFYDLGKCLRAFARYESDTPPGDALFDYFDADRTIRALLDNIPIPLGVSRDAAQALLNSLSSIARAHFEAPNADGVMEFAFPKENAEPIPSFKFAFYRRALDTFETVFSAEMRDATTYFVPRRGIFSTTALVDEADASFPPDLRAVIPDKTKEDWKSAGRCLAFNLLSASGFHVARAVEGTLENYFQFFSQVAPGSTLKTWGDYIKDLEERQNSTADIRPNSKTIAELRQMKDDYRNPIMHPRVVLSEADARMLFNNGESLIIAMASEINSAKRSK